VDSQKRRLLEVGDRVIFWPTTSHIRRLNVGTDYIVREIHWDDSKYENGKSHPIPRKVRTIYVDNEVGNRFGYAGKHFIPSLENVVFNEAVFAEAEAKAEAVEATNFHLALNEL